MPSHDVMRPCVIVLVLSACWSHAPQPPFVLPAPAKPPIVKPSEPAISETVAKQRESCAAGETWDCVPLGLAYQTGDGAPLDVPMAARYYELACDANIPEACALLLNLHRGVAESFDPDPAKAAALSQKLCDLGFPEYCAPPVDDPCAPPADEP